MRHCLRPILSMGRGKGSDGFRNSGRRWLDENLENLVRTLTTLIDSQVGSNRWWEVRGAVFYGDVVHWNACEGQLRGRDPIVNRFYAECGSRYQGYA